MHVLCLFFKHIYERMMLGYDNTYRNETQVKLIKNQFEN